jgi:hypothetical protein
VATLKSKQHLSGKSKLNVFGLVAVSIFAFINGIYILWDAGYLNKLIKTTGTLILSPTPTPTSFSNIVFEPYQDPGACLHADGEATGQVTIIGTWNSTSDYDISVITDGSPDGSENPIFENKHYCDIYTKKRPLTQDEFKKKVEDITTEEYVEYTDVTQDLSQTWNAPYIVRLSAQQKYGFGMTSCKGDTGEVPACFFYSLRKQEDFGAANEMCKSLTRWSEKRGCYSMVVKQFASTHTDLSLQLCDAQFPKNRSSQSKEYCYEDVGEAIAATQIERALDICHEIKKFDSSRKGCADFIRIYQEENDIGEKELVLRCLNYQEGDEVTKYLCKYGFNSHEKYLTNGWCAHRHLLWMYGNLYKEKSLEYCKQLEKVADNPESVMERCLERREGMATEIQRGPISSAYQFLVKNPNGLGANETMSCFSN